MTELQERRHGLESLLASCCQDGGNAGVTIEIVANLGHINLRGNSNNASFAAAVSATLGQDLPVSANTMANGDHRVFWLGPDEWLIVTRISDATDLLQRLRKSLPDRHASVTDVSGGQIAMRLAGPGARDVLAKGCTLDFHPDKFRVGACAQSGLARANVLIGLIDDQPTYEIVIRRSFAEYLVLWLRHAAGEYGVKVSAA